MTYLFKLALKNILRSKIRTVLTFLILSFGVGIYILFACLMAGFDKESIVNVIDFETGHYKVRSANFDEDQPYDKDGSLANAMAVKERLRNLDFITAMTERLMFLAEIDNGVDSIPVVAIGIGPDDNTVFNLKKYVKTGGLEPGGTIIGKALADDLGLQLGDVTFLTFRNQQGMYTSVEVLITGLIVTANPQVNKASAFINLDEAQQLMNTRKVTEIALKTDAFFKVKEYEPKIKAALSDVDARVYSWEKLSEDFRALMTMKRKFQNVLVLMIMIIAIVGIINTMLMSVFEKKREIGTMKALGFTDKEVQNLFLVEGALIGVAGGLAGLVLGTLFNAYFAFVGFDMDAMFGEEDFGMPVMGVVKSVWLAGAYVNAMVFTLVASVLASYYPAKKVTKMEAMECLRTVQ
ncbi:ABC transporter permease [candidate division FCPU426 bacterium]|nr:ABC transporter permease [candidate division FCPU426 bacterium]